MNKFNFKGAAIYLLALANLVYAILHGFTWLHILTFALTGLAIIVDVLEAIRRGR